VDRSVDPQAQLMIAVFYLQKAGKKAVRNRSFEQERKIGRRKSTCKDNNTLNFTSLRLEEEDDDTRNLNDRQHYLHKKNKLISHVATFASFYTASASLALA
jgi:hypothetical protein